MDVKKFYFSSLFFIYGFVLIICDNTPYLKYLHAVNALIGISFLVDIFFSNTYKIYFNTFFKIFLLFVVVVIFSSFLSEDFLYSAKKSLTQVLIFLNIFIIYNINKKYDNYLYLVYGIFAALLVNFLWLIGLVDLGLVYKGWRFQGSVLQANNFVFILLFGIMMSIYLLSIKKSNILFDTLLYLIISISLYMVFFTASKAGLASSIVLILLFIYILFTAKNIYIIPFIVIGSYGIIYYTPLISFILENSTLDIDYTMVNLLERLATFSSGVESGAASDATSTTLRLKMIYDALDMWSMNPLFGNGASAFEIEYGHYSHNNIMELLVSFGIIGFVLYYLLYVYLFLQIKKIFSVKIKIMFAVFCILFLFFDQSIVSYSGKFKILALALLYFTIQEVIKKEKIQR